MLAAAPPAAAAQTSSASPAVTGVQQLRQELTAATRLPGVERGIWGVAVHSLDRDERLFELNPRTLLVPASVAKIFTLATAVDAVGWNFRYDTPMLVAGPVVDGVLNGDLIVAGSGDPSIGGRGGDDLSAWIEAVRSAGIRRIAGRLIGDDDAIEEPRPQLSWAWDDLGYTSGAIFGALNFNENRTTITVSPGTQGGPTVLTVQAPFQYRQIANGTVTGAVGSPALIWPEQRPGEPALTIAGTIPAGARPFGLGVAVGNPTLYFAQALFRQLSGAGIEVTGGAFDVDDAVPAPDRAAARPIYSHRSRSLSELAQPMLKDSVNLYAEAMLRLNVKSGVVPTNDAALEGVKRRLEAWGVPPSDQQLVDGSGLSRRDVVTAEALLTILRRMHSADATSPFMAALSIAGVDGTLASRMRATPAERNVRGKSGTMSNIRSLAGYVTTADGEQLAFVVIVNNFEGPGVSAIQAIDAIAVRLAAFRRER